MNIKFCVHLGKSAMETYEMKHVYSCERKLLRGVDVSGKGRECVKDNERSRPVIWRTGTGPQIKWCQAA
ncbi:hypothetical protein TNCV_1584251 [Trichonephila clavipes]|nr:hypothetical protein TNCV_1584251 [Trichonephila clavipes]